MKGVLTKIENEIENDWFVKETLSATTLYYPLHPDYIILCDDFLEEGKEVEFLPVIDAKINMITEYAQLIGNGIIDNQQAWFEPNEVFPPFDKWVLGYYKPEGSQAGAVDDYFNIIKCYCVKQTAIGKTSYWVDKNDNPVEPISWCYLPTPPIKIK